MEYITNLINEIDETIITNKIQDRLIINDFERVCKIFWNYCNECDKHSKFQDYFKMNDLDYFEIKLNSIKSMI